MARVIFIMFILGFLTWLYMGGTTKTVADYKGMSRNELETLCLEKKGQKGLPKNSDRLRKRREGKRWQTAVLGFDASILTAKTWVKFYEFNRRHFCGAGLEVSNLDSNLNKFRKFEPKLA